MEVEVLAAADREPWVNCLAHDAACLPFGVVGELRRKLGPVACVVLLLGMVVDDPRWQAAHSTKAFQLPELDLSLSVSHASPVEAAAGELKGV